jgi:small subunit ribosomal protein S6
MREYEIMLILPAEADDKVIGGVTDRIGQVVARSGGEVTKADRWGRRRFAYEINRTTEGFYLVVEFTADPGDVKELERVLTLADDVIRFKTVVLPPKRTTAEYRPRRAEAAPASDSVATAEPGGSAAEPAEPEPDESESAGPGEPAAAESSPPDEPGADEVAASAVSEGSA